MEKFIEFLKDCHAMLSVNHMMNKGKTKNCV